MVDVYVQKWNKNTLPDAGLCVDIRDDRFFPAFNYLITFVYELFLTVLSTPLEDIKSPEARHSDEGASKTRAKKKLGRKARLNIGRSMNFKHNTTNYNDFGN